MFNFKWTLQVRKWYHRTNNYNHISFSLKITNMVIPSIFPILGLLWYPRAHNLREPVIGVVFKWFKWTQQVRKWRHRTKNYHHTVSLLVNMVILPIWPILGPFWYPRDENLNKPVIEVVFKWLKLTLQVKNGVIEQNICIISHLAWKIH